MVTDDSLADRGASLEAICQQARVAIMYVFGSRASEVRSWLGAAEHILAPGPSDVDVAVKFLPHVEIGVDQRVSLMIALEDLMGVSRVDLVDLDQADAFVAANAIRGSRLYAQDGYLADEYDLYVLRRAGDLAPLERERLAQVWSREYPALLEEARWGPLRCRFQAPADVPSELIANVNVVLFVGDRGVVVRLADGSPEMPGGTLEPGEDYEQALRRELGKEAGAGLLDFTPFGAWHCRSDAPEPYRPHLPHPESYRLVGYGDVSIGAQPQLVAGGEEVAAVLLVSPEEAATASVAAGRPDLADLYRLAARLRAWPAG